jgi:hypothetical protein
MWAIPGFWTSQQHFAPDGVGKRRQGVSEFVGQIAVVVVLAPSSRRSSPNRR